MVSFLVLVRVGQVWRSRNYVIILAMIPIMADLEFPQYWLILFRFGSAHDYYYYYY